MSPTEQQRLDDTRIGIFVAPVGTEEIEFTEPRDAVTDAGASVDVLSSAMSDARTVNGDLEEAGTYAIDRTYEDVGNYDALIVPGGTVGADRLRLDEDAVDLLGAHVSAGRPAGVICHGPWLLVEADLVAGRTLTSFPSLATDVRNAGGEWVDEEVVRDDGVVTSRTPDDLDAFCDAIVDEFASVPVET